MQNLIVTFSIYRVTNNDYIELNTEIRDHSVLTQSRRKYKIITLQLSSPKLDLPSG